MGGEHGAARLGELCELRAGVAFPHRFQGRAGGELPFLKVSDLSLPGNELLLVEAQNAVDAETAARLKARPVPAGAVIFAKIGEAIRQNRKRLTVRPTLLDNNLMAAIPREGVDPRYLYYLLCTLGFEAFIEGSALPYLKASVLARTEVALPPLPEQRRIAGILGTLDERLELNRQLNRTLEALAAALFHSWFVEFYPVVARARGRQPLGMSREAAALFPRELVMTGGGPLPRGWRWGTLGEVAREVRVPVHPGRLEGSTPYLGLEHMPRRSIALSRWGTAAEVQSQKLRFQAGHLLFGRLRPAFHKVGIAPVEGICSMDIAVVEPVEPAFYSLVLGHLSSAAFVSFASAGSGGTRMPRTRWEHLARYQIALPEPRCAEALNQATRPLLDRLNASIHEGRTLASLRDLLLPRLVKRPALAAGRPVAYPRWP